MNAALIHFDKCEHLRFDLRGAQLCSRLWTWNLDEARIWEGGAVDIPSVPDACPVIKVFPLPAENVWHACRSSGTGPCPQWPCQQQLPACVCFITAAFFFILCCQKTYNIVGELEGPRRSYLESRIGHVYGGKWGIHLSSSLVRWHVDFPVTVSLSWCNACDNLAIFRLGIEDVKLKVKNYW